VRETGAGGDVSKFVAGVQQCPKANQAPRKGKSCAMALIITDECINSDVCEPNARTARLCAGEEIYVIDPEARTECATTMRRNAIVSDWP
jgi:hypothetical protein